MEFTSILFLFFFFPFVIIINFFLPNKFQNLFLVITSIIFLFLNDVLSFLILITLSIFIYIISKLLIYYKDNFKISKFLFLFCVISIILIFTTFIYYQDILSIFSHQKNIIPTPIGISFYTIQAIGYIVLIYKGNVIPEKNFNNFLLYMIIFPKHFFGPVLDYQKVMIQINSHRKKDWNLLCNGVILFIKGLSKKVIIADNLLLIIETIKEQNLNSLSVLTIILSSITLFIYIYFLFSSYSDMSIGILKMMSIDVNNNFNNPFMSKSLSEFFTRFNISFHNCLSNIIDITSFNKEHLKIKNTIKTVVFYLILAISYQPYINMTILSLYIIVIILIEKLILTKNSKIFTSFYSHIYFIVIMFFGMIIIMFDNLRAILSILKVILIPNIYNIVDDFFIYILVTNILIITISIVLLTPLPQYISAIIKKWTNKYYINILTIFYMILFFISLAYIISNNSGDITHLNSL